MLEGFYSVHVKVRYLHDKTYQKGPRWYKNWSDKSYSDNVHKATFMAFIISFVFFQMAQSLMPYLFNPARPQLAMAGSNSKTWTTNGDFHYNKTSFCNQITHDSSTVISGADYTDGTCAAAAVDANITTKFARNYNNVKLDAGTHHVMAIKPNGSVWGSGYNPGSLGTGNSTQQTSFVASGMTSGAIAVSSGYYYTLALKSDGSVWGTGANAYGNLGTGNTTNQTSFTASTISSGALAVAAGKGGNSQATSLVLKSDGSVWGAGYNQYGQIGNGNGTQQNSFVISNITSGAVAIAEGSNHSLVLKSDGSVWSAGANSSGQLGTGNTTQRTTFGTTNITSGAVAVAAGDGFSLVLKSDGSVWASGTNTSGQLGIGNNNQQNSFVATGITSGAVALSAGGASSLVVKSDGSVWGTGANGTGQLGTGNYTSSTSFVATTITSGALSVSTNAGAGGVDHTSVLKSDGSIWSTGNNQNGQLAINSTTTQSSFTATNITSSAPADVSFVGYQSPAVSSGYKIDAGAGNKSQWNSVSWNATTPTNTSVKFNARTSNDNSTWSSWSGDLTTAGGSSLTSLTKTRYLELQLTLATSDGVSTPTLNDFTVTYDTIEAPANPNTTIKKTDNSSLKTIAGADLAAGVIGGFTSEASAKVTTTGLTCTGCSGTIDGRKIQVQYATAGTSFTDETTNLVTGDSSNNGDGTYSSTATLSNLSAGGYHLRMRATDNAGRFSTWSYYGDTSDTSADFTVDQTAPTIQSISINTGAAYTASNSATVTFTNAADAGSRLGKLYLSNNGTDWTDVTPAGGFVGQPSITGNISNWDLNLNLQDTSDGPRTVYAKVVDNAGNNSDSFSKTLFNDGSLSNVETINSGGSIRLTAGNGGVTEGFSTTTYKDAGTTTANWDTASGYLKLPAGGYGADETPGSTFTTDSTILNSSVGYRFIPTVDGRITGLRRSLAAGSYASTVKLYSDGGSLLASCVTASTSGWQSCTLSSPYYVTAGTAYKVVSYSGSSDVQKSTSFAGPQTIGNIQITSGGACSGSCFPTTWYTTNMMWVDIVYQPVVFSTPAVGQSARLNDPAFTVTKATLTATQTLNGGAVSYEMTANGGTNWESVTSGVEKTFSNPGNDLRWRATLSTPNTAVTPLVDQVSISYYPGSYSTSGTYTSIVYDSQGSPQYSNFVWTESKPSNTNVVFEVRGGNVSVPDGTWTNWEAISNGGSAVNASGKRYLQFRFTLSNTITSVTPQVDDVAYLMSAADSITLDTAPPASFSLSNPADNTWQGSSAPTLSWAASSDPSGIAKYQLYVDGTLNRDNISGGATSTTPSPALSEGMHTWYVKAVDGAGNVTTSSNTLHVGYDATVPAAPASFTVTGGTDTITLAWSFSNNTGAPLEKVKVERIDWINYDSQNPGAVWSGFASYKSKEYDGATTGAAFTTSDVDPTTKIVQGRRYAYRISGKDSVNGAYGDLSTVKSGLTQDSIFDVSVTNVSVTPCDGSNNCSTKTGIPHKGYETKITWNPAVDTGVGTSHYLIYRSTQDLNEGNYTDANVRASYQIVGVLPYTGGAQQPVWYDNNANNDATTTFYDVDGNPFTLSPEVQALTTKTVATAHLDDYGLYYYRIVGVDASNNKSSLFAESATAGEFDVLKVYQNGNEGLDAERTPDVTAPTVPTGLSVVATGIDTLNSTPDPTQGMSVSWDPSTENSGRAVTYRLYRSAGTSGGPDGNWSEITLSNSGQVTSFQDEGLNQNTYYYYRLTAQDPDANVSAFCDPAGAQTKNSQVPTTPTYVTVRATKGNPTDPNVGHQISVQFNGSTIRYSANHITGYEVYRSTTNYATEAEWLSSGTKVKTFTGVNYAGYDGDIAYDVTRSFTDTVSDGATTYNYKVRALGENSDGVVNSGLSAIQTGTLYYGWDTTPDVTAPALPAELKVKDIHDDGLNYKRNIITWARIATPLRAGSNDFKEYRIYRSNDGVAWEQICKNGSDSILLSACTSQYPNPLYSADKEIGLATNYYMDLIPIADSNQYYYYYVTAVDDAAENYKYPNGTIINNYSNESAPERNQDTTISSVSLNPAIAYPSITTLGSGLKASLTNVGVSSATVNWTTDQPSDSMVQFRPEGSEGEYKEIGVGDSSRKLGMAINHSIDLFGLLPNTTYEYIIVSKNSLSNPVTAEGSALPTLTTSGFVITPGTVSTTTSAATITWTTNLDASSAFVEYTLQRQPGDEPQGKTVGVEPDVIASSPKNHRVDIGALRSNRTYTYKIKSISKDGYVTYTDFATFKTKSFDSEQFTLAPSSSNVAERNITSTTAQIVWQTGSPTTSWVDYGTKSGVYDISAGDNNLTSSHVVVLTGLVPGTKYYYRVRVKDSNEVEFTSQEYIFTAVLKPKIEGLTISNVTPYSVTISWNTNVDTETLMNWGTSTAYGVKQGNAVIGKIHSVTIDNLQDNTEYHYQILAHDQAGNEVADDDRNVRTPLDTNGPKISDVKNDILLNEADNTAQVIISWKTDKPATTLVQYDEGVLGGRYSKATVEDAGLSNTHTVIIKDLDPGITYHYRIVTRDKRSNETISNDYNFITPTAEKSVLQLILKSLEETFSWIGNLGKFFSGLSKKAN